MFRIWHGSPDDTEESVGWAETDMGHRAVVGKIAFVGI